MKINGTEYTMPELNFNTMCKLEDMGVSLTEMDQKVLTTVRGFLALAMDDDMEKAGMEIEQHLASGGSLDPLMESINKAVNESGFFRALSQSQEKGNAASTETSGEKTVYLPGALQIGVDYGLFWRLTPKKLEPFLKAYESRQKEQLEFINIAGWVNGMYAGYSLGAAFGENVQYPEKPVQIFRSEEDVEENNDWEAEYFSAYAAMFNKQFEEKGGTSSCSDVNIPQKP